MNYVDYRFSLDVQEIGSQVFLTVKQGDTNRRLIINLTEGHEPYTIVEGCTAVLAGTKADGNVIFNNAVIEGNNIIYDFTEQTVAAVGSVKCEMRLYMEGRKLCSPNFTISVLPEAVGDAQIESLTEVNTLTGLINEATALIEDVNADLESGAFVPELEIGIVETLPTGANATASITGSGKNPVLNLGLPRGPVGTADGLAVDATLSKDSINPIQNKAVAIEFERVRDEQKKHIVVGPSEPDNGPALWFNTNYASGGAVAAMLALDDDETGAAMIANIEGNDYAMNNATMNSVPTPSVYDFTVI